MRPPSRRLSRTVATLAIGAVVTTGSIALAPAEPAQASWQGTTDTWLSSLNQAIGTAGTLFGIETGPFNIAATLAGPLISTIFGTGGGPDIQDVLDKLQELDDIEHRIDQMQSTLADIEQGVLEVNQNVLMGTCTIQTSGLTQYIAKVKTAQEAYGEVLDEIEELRSSGATDGQELRNYVESFITTTLGASGQTNVSTSAMAVELRGVHEAMISTSGREGVIQSCGKAYYDGWKLSQTAQTARTSVGAGDQGVWLDDRQYYEPLQNIVEYWQTTQAQGMFLLQQASLMQAAKLYTADKGAIAPDQSEAVCALATSQKSGNAKTVCDSGLRFSKTFYEGILAEWKQVGLPISDDQVVLSLGTDITGISNGSTPIASAVWARTPSTFPVDWTGGSWHTAATAATVDGIAGFVPADSTRWRDLEAGYRTSHLGVVPAVQTPVQLFRGQQPWDRSGVKPFAPLDLLATMRDSKVAGSDTHSFDTSGVNLVWMPAETTTRDMPAWRFDEAGYSFGYTKNLAFPPTSVQERRLNPSWVTENGLTIKCMVAPIDGVLCDSETIASWFIAHQKSDWSGRDKIFSVIPSSSTMQTFEARSRVPVRCETYGFEDEPQITGCEWEFDQGVTELPNWLALFEQKTDGAYDPAPSNQTLWPAAPVPADCAKTSWGVPTRCGASMDAWLKANIPNPSVSGPVPVSAPVVTAGDSGWAVCPAPAWAEVQGETGVAVQTGDVTWSGFRTDGDAYMTTTTKDAQLSLNDFAKKAGWYPDDVSARPASFTLRCSLTARFVDLATTTTVTSALATVRLIDGQYYELMAAGAAEPSAPAPTPGAGAGSGSAAGAAPGATGSGTLAATGNSAAPWLIGSALVLLAGAVLALTSRLRRRAS